MPQNKITPLISITGLKILEEQLASSPQGILLALAHMGNWEVLARLNGLLAPQRPSAAFYRPLNNPLMNRKMMKRRSISGTHLFSNKDGFTNACTHLRMGGLLGILADQDAGNSGMRMPFFGRNTSCSPLLEILHKRTGAAIFYVSMARVDRARWQVTLRKHLQDEYDTSSIMRGIETSLNSSRCDGFWFHNRWKQHTKKPFLVRQTRTSKTSYRQNKPWQAAIILSNDPRICSATFPAIEQMITQQNEYHFFILNAPADFRIQESTNFVSPSKVSLRDQLCALDQERIAPIDFVIFFTAPEEQFDSRKCSAIPWNAGFSGEKSPQLSTKVPLPNTTLTDTTTWHYFIEKLGSTSL